MLITFVSLYLKLNIVLLFAFALWAIVKKSAQWLGLSLSFNHELKAARYFFAAALIIPLFFSFINTSLISSSDISMLTVIGQGLSGNIENGLKQEASFATQEFTVVVLVLTLLSIGLLAQLMGLYKSFFYLNKVIADSVIWKRIRKTSIVFSQDITTPFSTQALGSTKIVLPYQLLESPQNFRLAIKHELQHVRNGDLYWVLVLDLIKPLFFWNPAFYIWHNEFHCLQEYACDEALLKSPSVNAKSYGSCLLEVASHISHKSLLASSNMVPNFALFRPTKLQLKRRIEMLTQVRNERLRKFKASFYSGLLICGLAACSMAVIEPPTVADREEVLPVYVEQPRYPQEALDEKIVGWAHVTFDIDENGDTVNSSVVDSCALVAGLTAVNEGGCIRDSNIFDAVSLAAIANFKFNPRVVDGLAVLRPEVSYLFRYTLAPDGDAAETESFIELLERNNAQLPPPPPR